MKVLAAGRWPQAKTSAYMRNTARMFQSLQRTLDVVTEHLPVALGASLSEPLPSLAAARHGCLLASVQLVSARNSSAALL